MAAGGQCLALRRQIGAFAEQVGGELRHGRRGGVGGGVGREVVQRLRRLPGQGGKRVADLRNVAVQIRQGSLKTAVALLYRIEPARRDLSGADEFAHHLLALAVQLRPLRHALPRFQQQLPLAVIRRHALRQQ